MTVTLDMVDCKLKRSRQASADRRRRAAGRHLIVEHLQLLIVAASEIGDRELFEGLAGLHDRLAGDTKG